MSLLGFWSEDGGGKDSRWQMEHSSSHLSAVAQQHLVSPPGWAGGSQRKFDALTNVIGQSCTGFSGKLKVNMHQG